ncbi:hypothetical protein C8A01DRAFT_40236, partial [Parachaetomium inaequale]
MVLLSLPPPLPRYPTCPARASPTAQTTASTTTTTTTTSTTLSLNFTTLSVLLLGTTAGISPAAVVEHNTNANVNAPTVVPDAATSAPPPPAADARGIILTALRRLHDAVMHRCEGIDWGRAWTRFLVQATGVCVVGCVLHLAWWYVEWVWGVVVRERPGGGGGGRRRGLMGVVRRGLEEDGAEREWLLH